MIHLRSGHLPAVRASTEYDINAQSQSCLLGIIGCATFDNPHGKLNYCWADFRGSLYFGEGKGGGGGSKVCGEI